MKITYWSDYACPYCYIGEARLKKAIANVPELGEVELEMKAFQLDPTAGEHPESDTQTRFAKKYGLTMEHAGRSVEHISKMGREEGLEFHYAETQFTNTMDAHRLTKLAQSKGDPALAQRVVDALFHAYFGENKELADKALLQEIGVSCGLEESEVKALLNSDLYRDEVILDEREAARYGIHYDHPQTLFVQIPDQAGQGPVRLTGRDQGINSLISHKVHSFPGSYGPRIPRLP